MSRPKEATNERSEFVTLLRRHRLSKGLTQNALAKRLRIDPSCVSFWESGTTIPSPRMIPKLARVLGLDALALTRLIEPELEGAGAK
jgi:transcriptional regulator with XRE-family HTH domain